MRFLLPALTSIALFVTDSWAADPKAWPGMKAPPFTLDRLTGGQVSSADLSDKHTLLVVGLTRESAGACKAWMTVFLEKFKERAHVYNVVVADKAWYLPRSAVRGKLNEIVPKYAHDRILVDWGKDFGIRYGLVKENTPTVFVIDREQKVVWRYKGLYDEKVVQSIDKMLPLVAKPQATEKSTSPNAPNSKPATPK